MEFYMRNMKLIKAAFFASVFAAFTLTVSGMAFAEEVAAEESAGDSVEEADYTEEENTEEEEKEPVWFSINISGFSHNEEEADEDPWQFVGIVNEETVSTGILVHADPDENSEVTGSLLPGCGMKVVYQGDEWSEITSGWVSGFVHSSYLLVGEEAKELAEAQGVVGVEANWNDVNVFEHPDANSWIPGSVDEGTVFPVVEDQGHWIAIQYTEDFTGYVSEEDVHDVLLLPVAVVNDGSVESEEETEEEPQEEENDDEAYEDEGATDSTAQQETYTESTSQQTYTEATTQQTYTETTTQQTYTQQTYTQQTEAPQTEAPQTEATQTEATQTEATQTEASASDDTSEDTGEEDEEDDGEATYADDSADEDADMTDDSPDDYTEEAADSTTDDSSDEYEDGEEDVEDVDDAEEYNES